jgi:HPt (histidine-containing phosphotransfer) domain-containing protein
MNSVTEIAPGLQVRGMRPPIALDQIKLLVFGMDSAMLYPGAQELADACSNAGIGVNMTIGEATHGLEKQRLLLEACLNLNIEPQFVMVVGRATSDLPMIAIAGISIAFMASSDVAAAATLIVGSGSLDRALSALVLPATKGAKDLDLSVLETLVNHDPVKFKKFALLFIDSIETVLLEIDSGIATLDMPKLMGMGHRAKSTAKNIGAEGFSSQCLLLEQTARTGDLTAAIKIAQGLRPQFNTIREAILRRLTLSA